MNETVYVAKQYLDSELAKYENWEEVLKYPNSSIRVLFSGVKGDFLKARQQGVGQVTLKNFLGKNWKQWTIQERKKSINRSTSERRIIMKTQEQIDPRDPTGQVKDALIKLVNTVDIDNCLLLCWNEAHDNILFSAFLSDGFLEELIRALMKDEELFREVGQTVKLLSQAINSVSLARLQNMN